MVGVSMFKKVINSIKEGTFFEKVKHKINVNVKKVLRKITLKNAKIDPKKVIFITFQGKYTCNPKAIAEEFIRRNSDYKLVWVVRKEDLKERDKFPSELKLVVRESLEFYKELASSKFIIENANDTVYMKYNKRPGQVIIQTWHGSLGFKRLDKVKNEAWVAKADELGNETDFIVSNSEFENMVYRTSYWENTEILEYGHARNDMLLNKTKYNKMNKKVREYYNIDKNTKILLYAPTFRDDFSADTYNLDYAKLLDAVKEKFGGNWVIMVRFHFKLRNVDFSDDLTDNIINATDYYDMQELLCAADIGITDYSSWLCDFVLTEKPGFIYCNDMDKYVDERGFYYPLSETPFPVSKTNDELEKNILNFDIKKYEKQRQSFLKKRGCYEKGNASKRIVDKIYELNK
jgi:CDP-glycerol glycerophosphotransferase